MSKFKRSKDKIWGTGARTNFCDVNMLSDETIKRINRRVYLQSKGCHAPVTTELKDWQKELMEE